jgi:hypothetical protein
MLIIKNCAFLFVLLFTFHLNAQDEQPLYYTSSPECFVKRFRNKELTIVPDKMFYNVALITKKLRRNPKFSAFKVDDDIYMTPVECLKAKNEDSFDSLDNVAISDQGREEKGLQEVLREERKSSPPASSSYSSSNRNKYYIEVGGGIVSVSSQNAIYPYYVRDLSLLVGQVSQGVTINKVNGPSKSKYKAKLLMDLGVGYRVENHYWAFRIKRFTASKEENGLFDGTVGTAPGQYDYNFKFKDTMTNIMIGMKNHFFEGQSFKPFFAGFLGITTLDSTFTYINEISVTAVDKDYQLSSSAIAASLESGFEYFFTNHLALNLSVGYEYLGHKELRVADKNAKDGSGLSNIGFKTGMNYSNIYGTAGLIFYW